MSGIMREKEFKAPLFNSKCEHCKSASTVEMYIDFEVFFLKVVPFFPVGRKLYTSCSNCGMGDRYENAPEMIRVHLKEFSDSKRTPVKWFTGPIFILVMGVIIYFAAKFDDSKTTEMIGSLNANAVKQGPGYYIAKIDSVKYTVYKLNKSENDSIYFFGTGYQANDPAFLRMMEMEKINFDKPVAYSQKDFDRLKADNTIINFNAQ
jgi:hypothetical protein